jgi:hypothetical protein
VKIKHLLALAVLAVVLVGLARWTTNRSQPAPGGARLGDKVLPGFIEKVNYVAAIAVQSPAGTALVSRVDGTWRVPGRYGYRADFGKVSDALRKLVDLKVAQVMRITPEQLADLHLLPVGSGNSAARATVVNLRAANGEPLAVLRIGKDHNRPSPAGAPPGMEGYPDGKFVAVSDTKVYLVSDMLTELAATDRDWIDQEFLNVISADLASIDVTGGTNGAIRLERPAAGGELTLKDVPAGKEVDAARVSRLTGALGYLRFEDVADPALAPAVTGLDKPVVCKAVTTKGTVYTVSLGATPANDPRRYASVSVAFVAPPLPAASATDTNAPAAAQTQAEEHRKTQAEARNLNDKLSPWVYLLGEDQVSALLTPAGEFLKDKPPAGTNTSPVTATTPAVESK